MLELVSQILGPVGIFIIIAAVLLISGIKILREYERAVIFRLGRMVAPRGPGITYVIPFVEKMVRVDLRTVTMDVPPQDVITRDNVSVKVSAVLYFRVLDPARAIREVEHYLFATSQLAQVTLRSVCGQGELDELLSEREKINIRIQTILDAQTEPWGVKVVLVELKHIDLPQEMQRAMGYLERFIVEQRLDDVFLLVPGADNDHCGYDQLTLAKYTLPALLVADIMVSW